MLSRSEQVARIIAAWAGHAIPDTTTTELAELAVTALECGAAHPDRPAVRCTQLPHGNGHLYHRNTAYGLEWWPSSAEVTNTVHDVLGPIQLVQSPVRADVEIRVPFIGSGENVRIKLDPDQPVEGTVADGKRGRYHTLPPCEDDQIPEDPTHDPDCTSATAPDRKVYRDLLPVLRTVALFLDRMGKRYREGNPRMNAETCRTAETHRDALRDLSGMLQDLLDEDGN